VLIKSLLDSAWSRSLSSPSRPSPISFSGMKTPLYPQPVALSVFLPPTTETFSSAEVPPPHPLEPFLFVLTSTSRIGFLQRRDVPKFLPGVSSSPAFSQRFQIFETHGLPCPLGSLANFLVRWFVSHGPKAHLIFNPLLMCQNIRFFPPFTVGPSYPLPLPFFHRPVGFL